MRHKSTSIKPRKTQASSYWGWLGVWLGLTGVAMLSATAGALLAVSLSATPLKQADLSEHEEAVFNQDETISYSNLKIPKLSRPVNILLLGTKVLTSDLARKESVVEDLGYHALVNSFDGLADTILLLRFDSQEKKLALLSIPRDTLAYIAGYGEAKINVANAYGGPALSAKAISEMLGGITIDRYVRVNVQTIEKLVNALGGVEVYVPKDMKYQDDSQHLYINLKEGKQHLDGAKAMQFLRFRYDRYGDIGRIQRQQMLMRALVEQTLKPSMLMRIPQILSVIKSNIDTNLTVEELVALTGFAAQIKRSDVQMFMLPGQFSGDGKEEISYWLPNRRRIRKMMAQNFHQIDYLNNTQYTTEPLAPSRVKIAIQDSTDNPEAVQGMVNYLREAGYSRIYVSEAWRQPLEVTKIVAQQGDESTAVALRSTLGIGKVLVESTGSLASDLTIQLGRDWQKLQLFEVN